MSGNTEHEQKQNPAGACTANREGERSGSRQTQEDVMKTEKKDLTENMLKNML